MATEGGTKAVIAALLANTGIAVTKFIAFLLTGASSMLAESVHSVADAGNQGLLLLGGKRARREATPEHPFGYGRERYVYAFIVAIVLFSIGGLFALYEAYKKYEEVRAGHPNELLESRWWWVPILVLLMGIVMETLSFRTAIVESNRVRGRRSWGEFIRSSKSPELPVILLEDLAALLGLVFALFGVGLSLLTENAYWDVVATVMIGVLLVVVAVVLAIEMKSLLLGEGASPEALRRLVAAIEGAPGIARVIHQRTLHVGPEELVVAAKVAVPGESTAADVAEAINAAEAAARESVPDLTLLIYLEPDIDMGQVEPTAAHGQDFLAQAIGSGSTASGRALPDTVS